MTRLRCSTCGEAPAPGLPARAGGTWVEEPPPAADDREAA